jgi:hypothetical protein
LLIHVAVPRWFLATYDGDTYCWMRVGPPAFACETLSVEPELANGPHYIVPGVAAFLTRTRPAIC